MLRPLPFCSTICQREIRDLVFYANRSKQYIIVTLNFFLLHNCVKMSVHMEEYSTMFSKSRSQPAIKDNHSKCFVMFLVDSFV